MSQLPGLTSAAHSRFVTRRVLSGAAAVLASLLLVCVTAELTLGFHAYGELLRNAPPGDRSGQHRALMRLWEDGFGGHLPKLVDLSHVAGYAFVIAVALVVVTMARVLAVLRANRAEARFLTALVPALMNTRPHPASYPVESRLDSGTSAQLTAANARIETSVRALTADVAGLGQEIANGIAVAATGLTAVTEEFTARISAAGVQAARDIGAVYSEAVAAAAADLEEKMTTIGDQLAGAAHDVRVAAELLGSSAGSTTAAVARLSELVADSRTASDN